MLDCSNSSAVSGRSCNQGRLSTEFTIFFDFGIILMESNWSMDGWLGRSGKQSLAKLKGTSLSSLRVRIPVHFRLEFISHRTDIFVVVAHIRDNGAAARLPARLMPNRPRESPPRRPQHLRCLRGQRTSGIPICLPDLGGQIGPALTFSCF